MKIELSGSWFYIFGARSHSSADMDKNKIGLSHIPFWAPI